MTVRQKVLLVEHDKDLCNELSALLFEHDYEVLVAATGEEAIRMTFSHCPEIILLERDLPDMDGLEVLVSVRKWSLLPVIMMSEQAEEEIIAEVLDAFADDYVVKPVGTTELLARMRTALRHTRTLSGDLQFANEGKMVVGRLTIDFNKFRVFVDEEDAGLTQNEFRIIGLLARYAGTVLSYKQIMHELWGPNAGNDNQILRVNMTNIRKKIEEDAAHPKYLFTENGIGYRMVTKEEAAQWELPE